MTVDISIQSTHIVHVAKATQCDNCKTFAIRLLLGEPQGYPFFANNLRVYHRRANPSIPNGSPVGNIPTPLRRIDKRELQTRREGQTSPGKQVRVRLRRKDASLEVIELTATGGLSPVGFSMVRCAKRAVATAITESAADGCANAEGKPVLRFPFCSRPGTALIASKARPR